MIGRRVPPSTETADKPRGFDDYDLRLGDIMRGERATLSKSLLDVQRELKIKASYIAAIENADASAFETPGFVAGYVRSYARYLGLEPEWAFGRFCDEAGFTVSHGMSAEASGPRAGASRRLKEYSEPLANPNASFVPRGEAFMSGVRPGAIGSVLVLVALIGGVGYGGWTVLREVQKVQLAPIDQAPGVIADLDPLAGAGAGIAAQTAAAETVLAALPEADTAPRTPDALERLYRPQTLDVPMLVPRDGPIAAIDPATVGALAGQVARAPEPEPVPALGETAGSGRRRRRGRRSNCSRCARPGCGCRPPMARSSSRRSSTPASATRSRPWRNRPCCAPATPARSISRSMARPTGLLAPGAQVVKNVALSAEALAAAYVLADLSRDEDLARLVTVADASPAALPAGVDRHSGRR